jgi:hypothetical protein
MRRRTEMTTLLLAVAMAAEAAEMAAAEAAEMAAAEAAEMAEMSAANSAHPRLFVVHRVVHRVSSYAYAVRFSAQVALLRAGSRRIPWPAASSRA